MMPLKKSLHLAIFSPCTPRVTAVAANADLNHAFIFSLVWQSQIFLSMIESGNQQHSIQIVLINQPIWHTRTCFTRVVNNSKWSNRMYWVCPKSQHSVFYYSLSASLFTGLFCSLPVVSFLVAFEFWLWPGLYSRSFYVRDPAFRACDPPTVPLSFPPSMQCCLVAAVTFFFLNQECFMLWQLVSFLRT